MKKIYIPIIALAIGFANACLAFQVHSMLFCLLPLLAFACGYFSSSWKTGLLSSFLLFIGYTTATALMSALMRISYFEPLEYLVNFIYGGFVLCLIGCGAPTVKRRVKNFKSIGSLVLLALLLSWCGYLSLPRYSYCYQVIIQSSEDLNDLEFHLPMSAVSQEPYTEILDYPRQLPELPEGSLKGPLLEDYSLEIVDTEHGEMLKLGTPSLYDRWERYPAKVVPKSSYPYIGSIDFSMPHAPHERLQFLPKYDVEAAEIVSAERFLGPIRIGAKEVVEEFKVPLKVSSHREAGVEIWLAHHWTRSIAINFAAFKTECYSERSLNLKFQTATSDEWILADGKAERGLGVGGPD